MDQQILNPIAQDLLDILPQINRLIAAEVRREVGEAASVAQLRLLTELAGGPQTLSSVARQQQVSPQALCVLANDLVERGWVERTPHPSDRRQQLLEVTDRGRAAFDQAREQALQQITPLLDCLGAAEIHAIAAALPALRRMLSFHDRSESAEPARSGAQGR